jgi:hypothetical protein
MKRKQGGSPHSKDGRSVRCGLRMESIQVDAFLGFGSLGPRQVPRKTRSDGVDGVNGKDFGYAG